MLPYTDMITVVYYSNRYTTRNTIVPLTRTEFTIPIFIAINKPQDESLELIEISL